MQFTLLLNCFIYAGGSNGAKYTLLLNCFTSGMVAFPLIGLSEQSRYGMSLVIRRENLYN